MGSIHTQDKYLEDLHGVVYLILATQLELGNRYPSSAFYPSSYQRVYRYSLVRKRVVGATVMIVKKWQPGIATWHAFRSIEQFQFKIICHLSYSYDRDETYCHQPFKSRIHTLFHLKNIRAKGPIPKTDTPQHYP